MPQGVERGYYQITSMYNTDFVRMTAKGAAPGNNIFADIFFMFISVVRLFVAFQIVE